MEEDFEDTWGREFGVPPFGPVPLNDANPYWKGMRGVRKRIRQILDLESSRNFGKDQARKVGRKGVLLRELRELEKQYTAWEESGGGLVDGPAERFSPHSNRTEYPTCPKRHDFCFTWDVPEGSVCVECASPIDSGLGCAWCPQCPATTKCLSCLYSSNGDWTPEAWGAEGGDGFVRRVVYPRVAD
eukprot:Sspe_Gene.111304::Locus_93155_Transcript_1_4_Confidence_0.333_Length_771::g.111304::m.111304